MQNQIFPSVPSLRHTARWRGICYSSILKDFVILCVCLSYDYPSVCLYLAYFSGIYLCLRWSICLSHVKKPFYCLTSKMRWFTLTQNYKYWKWDKILYFQKNQTLLLLFLMSLIFFKMQNFTLFSIIIILWIVNVSNLHE